MAVADYYPIVQTLYVAYFGRPADPLGLENFATALNNLGAPTELAELKAEVKVNAQLNALVNGFSGSAESASLYGTGSTLSFVTAIYQNLLNRAPDIDGLKFWVNAINNGTLTRANASLAIAEGAYNNTSEQGVEDAKLIDAKIAVATAFTDSIDTGEELGAYEGDAAIAAGRNLMSQVTAETTVEGFQATIDESIGDLVAIGNEGQTFTLTTGVDTSGLLKGSADTTSTIGNDQFIADNSGTNVTNLADRLDGGSGIDTLTIFGASAGDAVPQLSNIENVVLDNSADAASVNLSNANGVQAVTVQNSQGATTVTVGSGVAVTLTSNADATKAQTVNYGATATSGTLTLQGVTTNTAVDVAVVGAELVTLNLQVTGSKSTVGQLEVDAKTTTVNISGDQELVITDAIETGVTTVDASTLTGKLTIKSTNDTADQDATTGGVDVADITIKGGTAADTIDVSANAADNEVVVMAGAGNDTVTIAAATAYTTSTSTRAADVIDGGDGNDTLAVAGNLNASDLSGVIKGFEVINFTADANGTNLGTTKLGITNLRSTGADTDVVLTGVAAATTFTIADDGSDLDATIGTNTDADVLTVVLESTGTTTGSALVATNYDTLNITSTRAASETSGDNKLATVSASNAATVNINGAVALTGGTITAKAGATIDASALTGNLTGTTFGASVKSYVGGSGKDEITLVAGDLKQGNTFAGGAGTDSLTVVATSGQDLGIVGLTGFETLNLSSNAAAGDTVTADFRNVTGLTKLSLTAGDATDDFTLNRLDGAATLSFATAVGDVVTTINTGTEQKVAFGATVAVGSLTLDSGTASLTVTVDDGATDNEAGAAFTSLSGTSLASITVLGNDQLNLGTLASTVTTVNASGAKGALTVTASGTATTITGSQVADTITGGGAADTIQGGKGNDTLSGGAGSDTYVFEAKGSDNGTDTLTIVAGGGGDKLSFKNFLSGGSVEQNGAAGTGINEFDIGSVADVSISGKVAFYSDADATLIDGASEIALLIQGDGDAFSLTAGGKAVLITGDASGANDTANIWFIDDSLDGVTGTVSATDVVLVGTTNAAFDLDTLLTSNFTF